MMTQCSTRIKFEFLFENQNGCNCKTCFASCYRRERSFEHVAHAAPVPTDVIAVLT
eukprot:COSAG06_NODE_51198_length_313_cov_2.626168_2_plen_55_part_01